MKKPRSIKRNSWVFKLPIFLLILIMGCAPVAQVESTRELWTPSPEDLYGELFFAVQADTSLFPDSKTFVDARPLVEPDSILSRYSRLTPNSTTSLRIFLNDNFEIPVEEVTYQSDSAAIVHHINNLWEVLKRPADDKTPGTLLPLPNPYIVPGGRFREIYYWDSYFTMLGLEEDGETEIVRNMVDNFSYLIDIYGFIPNGNRSYYLSRSQPPFYSKMVELLAGIEGEHIFPEYLPFLEKEYDFWMLGVNELKSGKKAESRVVQLPGGEILNRYWDEKNTPRPESYREDVKTANEALKLYPERSREEVYRDLRAAAESGWDFSSRWLTMEKDSTFHLSSIHTTQIIPVDLNSLLFHLETTISKAYKLSGDSAMENKFLERSGARKQAMNKYLWNEEAGFYSDYNFYKQKPTEVLSLAGVYPLFFEISDETKAGKVAATVERLFLKPGGVVSTPFNTGQQWDAPNGWAPLQWITIKGLKNYGFNSLSSNIRNRWLHLNEEVYKRTFKMLEKYNVEDLSKESGGGEYPTQDGFGWTNGVYLKLLGEKKLEEN